MTYPRGFDPVATGLHLHEYTVTELNRMLKAVGFTHTEVMLQRKNMRVPVGPVMALESVVGALPMALSHKLAVSRRHARSAGNPHRCQKVKP